jgi:hypothetical protein
MKKLEKSSENILKPIIDIKLMIVLFKIQFKAIVFKSIFESIVKCLHISVKSQK